jgi:hypothetical protein
LPAWACKGAPELARQEPRPEADWRWSHPQLAFLALFLTQRSQREPLPSWCGKALGRPPQEAARSLERAGALVVTPCQAGGGLAWACSVEAKEAVQQWERAALALKRASLAKCESLLRQGRCAKAALEAESYFKAAQWSRHEEDLSCAPCSGGELAWLFKMDETAPSVSLDVALGTAMWLLWGQEGLDFMQGRAGGAPEREAAAARAKARWREERQRAASF